jgi:hypothetical protein
MTLWDDDDALMQDLGEAMRGAVSERAREAARAAFAWRTLDEELMRLSYDSLLSEEVLVRRAAGSPRVLGFMGSDLTLEVEVDGGSMMGQVVPGRVCRIAVFSPQGEVGSTDTDQSGIFSIAGPVAGPVRFRVTCEGRTQSTEWLTL